MVGSRFKQAGEIIRNPELSRTLRKIQYNPQLFYHGSLARQIVSDVRSSSGILTLEDLRGYKVRIRRPLINKFDDLTMLTMPPPGSGAVLSLIINILNGGFY